MIGGSWICYGMSRGGRACLDYARLYPDDDIRGYVPFVGVNNSRDKDPALMQFLYEEISDEVYGEERAAEIRQTIRDFQTELFRNKDILAPQLWEPAEQSGMRYFENVNESSFFDMSVFEFVPGFWMSGGDLDPWSSVYIDGGDNPHFHTYILSGSSHQTKIGQFDREIQNEIIEIMKSWLP